MQIFKIHIWGIILLLTACAEQRPEIFYTASFQNLDKPQFNTNEKNLGVFGGGAKKKIFPFKTEKASCEAKLGQLYMNFEAESYIYITPKVLGLPSYWENIQYLDLEIESSQENAILFQIYGSRTRKIDTLKLEQGLNKFSLDVSEMPLMGGINTEALYLKWSSQNAQKIILHQLTISGNSKPKFLVDRWGQRAALDYSNKIKSSSELKKNSKEKEFLAALENSYSTDVYGGFTNLGINFEKRGFFYPTFKQERWWLVSPKGNPFFSIGLNGVRVKSFRGNADVTRVQDRENIFEKIPVEQECPECFREQGKYFSFYCWNVKRKYDSFPDWRNQTYHRLRKTGFNTIGNWSDTLFYKNAELPYTYTLDTRKDSSLLMNNELPDVFNPAWEDYLIQIFQEIERFKDDPFLLGYFVDNEMGWRSIPKLDSASYTFQELKDISSIESQKELYAEKYFSTIEQVIKKYDPNHMYLGCRFTRRFDGLEKIAQVAGKYVDILSVNIYSGHPIREETDLWYNASQKPILIGEHHIPPQTDKQLLPHYPSFPEPQRSEMIENYVLTWLSYPYSLGSHWYQFKDQEVAGRGNGGENQPIGLVSISDQLNYDLAKIYHSLSQKIPNILAEQAE